MSEGFTSKSEGKRDIPSSLVEDFRQELVLYQMRVSPAEVKVYERMGVETFQKFYLATVGYVLSSFSKNGRYKYIDGVSERAIESAVQDTENLEVLHTVGGILMLIKSLSDIANEQPEKGVAFLAVNVLLNLYPVLLQRMRRFRLQEAYTRKKKARLKRKRGERRS